MNKRKKKLRCSEKAWLIRFDKKHAVQGFSAILHKGQATALPDNTYVVGEEQLEMIEKKEIPYEVIEEKEN